MSVILLCMLLSSIVVSESDSCYMRQYLRHADRKFEQKSQRFWEFNQQSNTWVEVDLPYDLLSCVDGNCTVVDSIRPPRNRSSGKKERSHDAVVAVRKRISLTKMSESSVWVTGESGSIYERFWNGLQWVVAPHDLPLFAGYAVSVFIFNQTILALSEAGLLYQMRLTEESQPVWVEFAPELDKGSVKETDENSGLRISSGVVSNEGERMYFCTKNGLLLELLGLDLPRWENHGRPPGADVAAITDAAKVRAGLLLIVSSAGDLYEYDQTSKPPWKKHIHGEGSKKDTSLAPIRACILHGLVGLHSVSAFLLTKGGEMIERRLHQRKWKWVAHQNPEAHQLTSITCISQDENQNSNSLFLTTASGFVFEYHIQKYSGKWVNHEHPPHAKAARGIAGLQLQVGRTIFPLDDGRLAELHLAGIGGESVGPNAPMSARRKSMVRYVWSVLDAPETEGWNAEYCTEERGPSNCILGTKEETNEAPSTSRWRKDSRRQQNYFIPVSPDDDSSASASAQDTLNSGLFRLRLMQQGKSFFLITDNDLTLEYLNAENGWFWLRHEHSTGIQGALGNYNGSLFVVDEQGSVLIRERSSSDLAWINCTAMRKGRQVIAGPPWDGIPGQPIRAKPEDAIFFVSTSGRLLQFTVALRKFKWKDCKNPPGIKIASIVDQEGFRDNIVFVVGRNGRLYQYNKVTQVWHQHYQSQHLVLSASPGSGVRASQRGSIFMLSRDGGLVEYQWSWMEGWNWVEHGTPRTNVTLDGAPGPCFGGNQLFLIGSDGSAYLRYLDEGEWKWSNCGFPSNGNTQSVNTNINQKCNPKVSSTRPIPFSEDSVIFELQDGRLAELQRTGDKEWIWSRTIATPTSSCMANFWSALAS